MAQPCGQVLGAPDLSCLLPVRHFTWGRGTGGYSKAVGRFGSELWAVSRARAGALTPASGTVPHQEAVAVQLEPERLVKILEVLRELPVPNYRCVLPPPPADASRSPGALCSRGPVPRPQPYSCTVWPCVTPSPWCPLYRTLEFLMRHLVHMASFSNQTNMHSRNLAIVWAPNLLRWAVCGQPVGTRQGLATRKRPGRAVAVWVHWSPVRNREGQSHTERGGAHPLALL